MPLITSNYNPAFYLKNGFISTVYSGLFRRVILKQTRERISLSDGDFLDLDWSYANKSTNRVLILLHGLEGHAKRPYMTGAARLFNDHAIDAVCVNFRGCSGDQNLKYKSYHSGATEDLEAVISHIIHSKAYSEIYIKGISLGANMLLKYLGERSNIPEQIKAAVAVSVPCDLYGSCQMLHKLKNRLFHNRFLKDLKSSLLEKQGLFPEVLSIDAIKKIKRLIDFDTIYTAKAHGFKSALDYYEKSSCLQFLPNIKTPTLIINALNDSFLSPLCFPISDAKNNDFLYLEMPKYGGHVGFIDKHHIYYNEKRALEFVNAPKGRPFF